MKNIPNSESIKTRVEGGSDEGNHSGRSVSKQGNMKESRKILVLMGSPRKGNTFRACEELREEMVKEIPVEFDYLWLRDLNILPCKGCLACFTRGKETCPNHDDIPLIETKIREADGVIFASPVYGMNVTSQMKVFIDRFCYNFHRPQFFDKKALLLTTTGILGNKEVLKYLETVARIWGFEIVGKIGLVTPIPLPGHRLETNRKAILKTAREFAAALRRHERKKPGVMDVVIFHGQRGAFSQLERVSPADYQYWKKKGWLDKQVRYFVDIPVNPLYHLIGVIVERLSIRQTRRDLTVDPGESS